MLRLAYLLEDAAVSGGVRVVLAQADALLARGHRVTIISKSPRPSWRETVAQWKHVDDFREVEPNRFDFIIATFWTTVAAAVAIAPGRAIHLCQGYEGAFNAYQPIRGEIDAAYALPIPRMTVAPHLADICRTFHPDAEWVGQIVDDAFFEIGDRRENRPLRGLVSGQFEIDLKGVDLAYAAFERARREGGDVELVRVTPSPPPDDEPAERAARFHIALTADEMTRLVASCDFFVGPNLREEGFGLPAAEAMAAALPVILSDIPSYGSLDARRDYALFFPEGDATALAEAIVRLAGDESLRQKLRQRGREVAEQFRAPRVAERIEEFLLARRGE